MDKSNKPDRLSRRDFLAAAGVAGAGTVLGAARLAMGDDDVAAEEPAAAAQIVPTRPFGNSGVDVPILSLGGMFDTAGGQLLLRQAVAHGVLHWDTAEGYGNGASETGMGTYLGANAETRAGMFVVTKSGASDPAEMTRRLDASLERLQTDYVDLFFMHGIDSPDRINDDAKTWAEGMKEAGKIKLFGFSTHRNMSACLAAAAEAGWIDGIMTTYNYRVKVLDEAGEGALDAAIDACCEAGIGLTAMKTQGHGAERYGDIDAEAADALVAAFLESGYSLEQAALKWVWQDERFACVCSNMPNMTVLKANIAAALDATELTPVEAAALRDYARATCSNYCAGCGNVCGDAVAGQVPVSDVMRYLMYYSAYGQPNEARQLFAELPAAVRRRLASVDYSAAEARCPQGIAIGERMKRAAEVLA